MLTTPDISTRHQRRSRAGNPMDNNPRPRRRARPERQNLLKDRRNHCQHPRRRRIPPCICLNQPASRLPTPPGAGLRPQPRPSRRAEMEELAPDHPGRDYVRKRQPRRRSPCVQTKCPGCIEGPERMRNLLLGYLDGHADAEQAVRDLQELVPLCLSLSLVQEQ